QWIEVQPVPDTSSKFAIVFLEQNILFRHGTPQRLISDQGTAFTSKLFSDWKSRWNIDHVFATAKHPETNGLVERVNRNLTLAFCAFVNTTNDDWDLHLSTAAFAINTARQATTEITPFELVHGRLPVLFIENMFPWPDKEKESHSQFLTRIADLRMAARVQILRKQ
ncbi:putative Histone-lysine N-methyltransferase NSD2, partial [Daphnia magna]